MFLCFAVWRCFWASSDSSSNTTPHSARRSIELLIPVEVQQVPQNPKVFPALSAVASDGGNRADGCTCVATLAFLASDGQKPNTKGFSMLLPLAAVDGLFGGNEHCPPPPGHVDVGCGGVSY